MDKAIRWFNETTLDDIDKVGGKNASLGELYQKLTRQGINVPNGFAVTAQVYWDFINENDIKKELSDILKELDLKDFSNLSKVGQRARKLILSQRIGYKNQIAILSAYKMLKEEAGENLSLAVRSSATAEDLPTASFAGQQESYLNISGEQNLINACLNCFASLFTDRAIKYRIDQGFNHMDVALSIGVQQMVRSDKASSGVLFTLEPESGFRDVIVINSAWGLGELIVKGRVDPDEFLIFKPSLEKELPAVINKKMGAKQEIMIYQEEVTSDSSTVIIPTPESQQRQWSLTEAEITILAKWSVLIESHYRTPMDIEWAKDGVSQKLYIVQARPETVHALRDQSAFYRYQLLDTGSLLVKGCGLGNKITSGKARILNSPSESDKLKKGEILVTDITDPDWDPLLKKAAGVITNKGGRTSHAAIVARELGAVAVVGAHGATEIIEDGQEITISCAEGATGYVYSGKLNWKKEAIDLSDIPKVKTKPMLIVSDPDRIFHQCRLPNEGVGLLRMEFIINNAIEIHPMALAKYEQLEDENSKQLIDALTYAYTDKRQFFIDKLASSIATVAAAFYPNEVIVRMSDFKSNEYANLIGGKLFEPKEENPMLGFRGASRYYSPQYQQGFEMECEAIKQVRNRFGFTNVKLMIPFCRSIEEGKKVLGIMESLGLKRGKDKLEIYVMVELPSNVLLAEQFAQIFDGFSIGTNDLTQLTLGLDRDNALISDLFNENNPAVKLMIEQTIFAAKKQGIKVGLCGQAPSDLPDFARFLVELGIDSISFNPDAIIQGVKNIATAESQVKKTKPAPQSNSIM